MEHGLLVVFEDIHSVDLVAWAFVKDVEEFKQKYPDVEKSDIFFVLDGYDVTFEFERKL